MKEPFNQSFNESVHRFTGLEGLRGLNRVLGERLYELMCACMRMSVCVLVLL